MKSLQEVYDVIAGTFNSNSFTGSGLNDMATGGTFTGSSVLSYRVQIDSTGTPDTFSWSDDGGSAWDATAVAITGSAQTLNNGVQITFGATTGHTLDNRWDFSTNSLAKIDGNIIQRLKYISGMTLQQIYNNSVSPVTITDSSASAILTIEQTGAGNVIELKDGTNAVFSVSKTGNISMGSSVLLNTDSVQISSGGASDLVLNAGSGKIKAAAGDAFYTAGGHPILASGEEIYRASTQIFGYDYPARTSLASFVQISRAIVMETDSFPAKMDGTTRVYKLSLRYSNDAIAGVSTWRVYNITDSAQEGASFTIPHTTTDNLDEGTVYVTPAATAIPIPAIGKKWRLDVQPPAGGTIQVYQIELAAYDRVD